MKTIYTIRKWHIEQVLVWDYFMDQSIYLPAASKWIPRGRRRGRRRGDGDWGGGGGGGGSETSQREKGESRRIYM